MTPYAPHNWHADRAGWWSVSTSAKKTSPTSLAPPASGGLKLCARVPCTVAGDSRSFGVLSAQWRSATTAAAPAPAGSIAEAATPLPMR